MTVVTKSEVNGCILTGVSVPAVLLIKAMLIAYLSQNLHATYGLGPWFPTEIHYTWCA